MAKSEPEFAKLGFSLLAEDFYSYLFLHIFEGWHSGCSWCQNDVGYTFSFCVFREPLLFPVGGLALIRNSQKTKLCPEDCDTNLVWNSVGFKSRTNQDKFYFCFTICTRLAVDWAKKHLINLGLYTWIRLTTRFRQLRAW